MLASSTTRRVCELPIEHQCCCVQALSDDVGCFGYYDLEDGAHSGGLQIFRVRRDGKLELCAGHWHCADAGIYEFQVRHMDAERWLLYAIDTRSRVWLVSCSRRRAYEFELAPLDDVAITKNEEAAGNQGTSVRVDGALNVLAAVTMGGGLLVADLRDFRPLWIHAHAHECEILSTAVLPALRLVATGSEDTSVRFWDVRAAAQTPSITLPRKSHGAGVTAVSPVPGAHFVLTGSYDDTMRLFDLRAPAEPVDVRATEGGVWDFVWSAQFRNQFLVPNCFGGVKRGFLAAEGSRGSSSWGAHELAAHVDAAAGEPFEVDAGSCLHSVPLVATTSDNETALFYAAAWFSADTRVVTSSFYERSLLLTTVADATAAAI